MMPLKLFRSRNFLGANLLTLFLYAALGGGLFFLPLNLIQVQGYSTTAAGAALLPFILLMFVLSRWAGGLVGQYGSKLPLIVGPLIAAAGYALLAVPAINANYWTTFFPAVVVLGVGMTVSVAPLTTTVMSSVDTHAAGAASGINNAVSRVASLMALAVMGVVVAAVFNHGLDQRLGRIAAPASMIEAVKAQRSKLAAIEVPTHGNARTRAAVKHAVAESFVAGFRWVMVISALLAVASALSAWIWISGESASGKPMEKTGG
jgi:predicted MFS family arabinose efflux permease